MQMLNKVLVYQHGLILKILAYWF